MAHFAKLDENNVVIFVTVGADTDDGKEDELFQRTGEVYKQTSYNTRNGIYYTPNTGQPDPDQSKAYRKNYAGIGYIYDATRDAFMPPQPFPSWVLNEFSCTWEAPVPYPTDGKWYEWDENAQAWKEVNAN